MVKDPDFKPIHPGEILREELLVPHNISPSELATALNVPKEQIISICDCEEKANITADLAVRLSLFFDSSIGLWLNLQRSYEEQLAEEKVELLKKVITPYKDIPDFHEWLRKSDTVK